MTPLLRHLYRHKGRWANWQAECARPEESPLAGEFGEGCPASMDWPYIHDSWGIANRDGRSFLVCKSSTLIPNSFFLTCSIFLSSVTIVRSLFSRVIWNIKTISLDSQNILFTPLITYWIWLWALPDLQISAILQYIGAMLINKYFSIARILLVPPMPLPPPTTHPNLPFYHILLNDNTNLFAGC